MAPTPRPGPTPRRQASSFVPAPARPPLAVLAQRVDDTGAGLEDLIATHIVNCTAAESTIYLPKGATRRYVGGTFVGNPIQETRDANGNVTTYTWTSFADQIRPYIWKVRDPVGREITYGHEPWFQECVQYHPELDCIQWKTHYRVRSVTDPYGRTATYASMARATSLGLPTPPAGRRATPMTPPASCRA